MFDAGVTRGVFVLVKAGTLGSVRAHRVPHSGGIEMTDTEYNGEQSAVSAAEHLWRALLDLNATDLDPDYRRTVSASLSVERAGSPFMAVRDALLSVLTVIVSADAWLTHVTSHRQVAESIYEALCESGETVAYHIERLRYRCLTGPVLSMEVSPDGDGYAYVTLRGTLNDAGDGMISVDCERVSRTPGESHVAAVDALADGEFSAYVRDRYERLRAGSWVDLAHAIARHYRLSGTVRLSTQGYSRVDGIPVAYGDPRAASAPA